MKIFQGMPSPTTGKLILAALVTVMVCSGANAQPVFSGKFVLPQEVRWNHAILPAGEYSIEMRSIGAPAVLRSKIGDKLYYTAKPVFADCQTGATQLNVRVHGNERSVRSLDIPELHRTLIFEPPTQADRESLAKVGNSESVAVEVARK